MVTISWYWLLSRPAKAIDTAGTVNKRNIIQIWITLHRSRTRRAVRRELGQPRKADRGIGFAWTAATSTFRSVRSATDARLRPESSTRPPPPSRITTTPKLMSICRYRQSTKSPPAPPLQPTPIRIPTPSTIRRTALLPNTTRSFPAFPRS